MNFKEEIVAISTYKVATQKTIEDIKDQIRESANKGIWVAREVYRLTTENKNHRGSLPYGVVDINVNPRDKFIIDYFKQLGFTITFSSVNMNPLPEFGQEGYSAAYFMNVEWKE